MNVVEFSNTLYDEIEKARSEVGEENSLEGARILSTFILSTISKLRNFITGYQFKNRSEEIDFFRNSKPRFLSKFIYYQKIFEIHSQSPVATGNEINVHYKNELQRLGSYIHANNDFLIYYRSGSILLDEIYFVRRPPDLWLSLNNDNCENDVNFTTIFDYKLSKLLAYEKVSEFLIESLSGPAPSASETQAHGKLTWTGSKAALIELIYALQTSGVCNNGAIDVKQLARHFEQFFNIKLDNFYRTFQEIRIRKISRTTFLDQLKENLIKRMDNSDENPRF